MPHRKRNTPTDCEKDPTTRRIFEDILAQEEEHADDMAEILKDL
jgi:bacterioferritin